MLSNNLMLIHPDDFYDVLRDEGCTVTEILRIAISVSQEERLQELKKQPQQSQRRIIGMDFPF